VLISDEARALVESSALAHLVTLEADGRPQMSCVWVGMDGDDIVFASLGPRRKLDNIARDPRVALSIEGTEFNAMGLKQYLVVHGSARIEEGGGPELLQRLAHTYLGADVKFPPMDDPPPGVVVRITPERLGGVGPWA
jgi:PPOX class probable F420-dependent enzyme